MIREEQAILMVVDQVREDFPDYQIGPMLRAENENQCWHVSFRLSRKREQMDVLYSVYRSGRTFVATLFDSVPYQVMGDDEQAMKCAADQVAADLSCVQVLDVSIFDRMSQDDVPKDPVVSGDQWYIAVDFRRYVSGSTAVALYHVWRNEGLFKATRVAIDEISRGDVRCPSGFG